MRAAYWAFFLFLILVSCQTPPPEDLGLSEDLADFSDFYHRFHRDSAYQMGHIAFPVQGRPDNYRNRADYHPDFRWTRENWTLHRPIDLKEFNCGRTFTPMGADLVIERLNYASGEYGMERRYARMKGEWMLIYYSGINPL
jgi:hypothetical protein